MSERDPQDRDPFKHLRDLIDEPVAPRGDFADELRSRLMRELSASDASREEHLRTMDAVLAPRPSVAFPTEQGRRFRPIAILELAAVAVLFLGLVAVLGNNWFGKDPNPDPAPLPAVAQQGNETPTPALTMVPTEASESMATPDANSMVPTVSPNGSFQPTVVPPGDMANPIWVLPGVEDGNFDFGGMLVEDGVVYRLIATSDFVGIQAIDGRNGVAKWQQAQQWAGDFFAIEDDTLYFGGGDNTLVAVDAETGKRSRTMDVPGNPIAMTEDDSRIFVLLDSDMVVALDEQTGAQLWVAQGTVPQNPTGGSTSMPAIGKIEVENGVVVAISTYGVLSGFDVQTGAELWSHDGYDSAMTTIESESDHIVVSSGMGLSTVAVRVGSLDDSGVQTAAASAECAQYFEPSTEAGATTAGAPGTAEAGSSASAYHLPGSTFRAQAIDPKTGEILWERQTISGAEAATVIAANPAGPAMCTVDAETGAIGYDFGSTASNALIMVGEFGSGGQGIETEDGTLVAIGTINGVDQPAIAAMDEDGAVYLQLADGSLVKIAASGSAGDDDHHEENDDDSEDTPEAGESSDD